MTVGVYAASDRVWRVKSKHGANTICAVEDEHCDAHILVSGWQNGKVRFFLLATYANHRTRFLRSNYCSLSNRCSATMICYPMVLPPPLCRVNPPKGHATELPYGRYLV